MSFKQWCSGATQWFDSGTLEHHLIDTDKNSSKASEVIKNKRKAIELKEKGNDAFKKKKYEVAEKFYSEALQLNLDSRPIWTNRASCRNVMKKHEDALVDCVSALSIDPKNTKKGIQTNETISLDARASFNGR